MPERSGTSATAEPVVRSSGLRAAAVGADLLLASCEDCSAMRTAEPPDHGDRPASTGHGGESARLLCEFPPGEAPEGTVRALPVVLDVRAHPTTQPAERPLRAAAASTPRRAGAVPVPFQRLVASHGCGSV
ncbi:hypothetical protein [Streptomyces sp. NPDC020298]|uniref:hypothetical protein n=1 Tax=unclassified Streptomyces TaxID=2593676 RepID=UPI0034068D23